MITTTLPTTNEWQNMIDFGFNTRKDFIENPTTAKGGLLAWTEVKEKYGKSIIREWSEFSLTLFDYFQSSLSIIAEESEVPIVDKNERHQIWEQHHFYFQHGRLPHLETAGVSALKLMQIAFNAGQLKYEISRTDVNVYTDKQLQYYNASSLDKMETYIKL